jgi:hypothetical protein
MLKEESQEQSKGTRVFHRAANVLGKGSHCQFHRFPFNVAVSASDNFQYLRLEYRLKFHAPGLGAADISAK